LALLGGLLTATNTVLPTLDKIALARSSNHMPKFVTAQNVVVLLPLASLPAQPLKEKGHYVIGSEYSGTDGYLRQFSYLQTS
jgi:hypothetical protein